MAGSVYSNKAIPKKCDTDEKTNLNIMKNRPDLYPQVCSSRKGSPHRRGRQREGPAVSNPS